MSESKTPEPAALKCFVIMPFSETAHTKSGATITIVPKQWEHIFDQWIKKAVESFPDRKITCKRSAAAPGNFVKGIVQDLNDSHLVVADLTGNRPNVYYELGIRNALRTGTVMITQDLKALPVDLHTYYCFEYAYTDKAHEYTAAFASFEGEMHEKLRHIISQNYPADNPVSDFLGFRHSEQSASFDRQKKRVANLLLILKESFKHTHDRYASFVARLEKGERPSAVAADLKEAWQPTLLREIHMRLIFDIEWDGFSEGLRNHLLELMQLVSGLLHNNEALFPAAFDDMDALVVKRQLLESVRRLAAIDISLLIERVSRSQLGGSN